MHKLKMSKPVSMYRALSFTISKYAYNLILAYAVVNEPSTTLVLGSHFSDSLLSL